MLWESLEEEQKRNLYESYRGEMWYEWGDKAKIVSYEEFCRDHEEYAPEEP